MNTEEVAHKVVDIVDSHTDAIGDTYEIDYYHAIEDVRRLLDKEIADGKDTPA